MSALRTFLFPTYTARMRRLPYAGWVIGLLFTLSCLICFFPELISIPVAIIAKLLYFRASALRARDAGLKARWYLGVTLGVWLLGFLLACLRGYGPDSLEFIKPGGFFTLIATLYLFAAPAPEPVIDNE